MIRFLLTLLLGLALLCGACAAPHYSVAVTTSPGRITFAQRHSIPTHNDYLVDCAMQPDGSYSDCTLVELVTPR